MMQTQSMLFSDSRGLRASPSLKTTCVPSLCARFLASVTTVNSCPPRYPRQQSMKSHSRIDAHPRPVNNETSMASAKHDPNSPSELPVKLLSVDERCLAQGPPLDDAWPQHSVPSSQHGDEEPVGAVPSRGEEQRLLAAVG